jgi:hypothetical protein
VTSDIETYFCLLLVVLTAWYDTNVNIYCIIKTSAHWKLNCLKTVISIVLDLRLSQRINVLKYSQAISHISAELKTKVSEICLHH